MINFHNFFSLKTFSSTYCSTHNSLMFATLPCEIVNITNIQEPTSVFHKVV